MEVFAPNVTDGGGESSTAQNIFVAAAWGLGSAMSLVLGAGIGIMAKPGPVLGASLMAFGGGALIEALSIELFGHIMHEQHNNGIGVTLVAITAAICGGAFFAALSKVGAIHSHFGPPCRSN